MASEASTGPWLGIATAAPGWPAIVPDEAAAVLARFPAAGRLAAVEWHSPRPFSAAALVRTDRGDLLVKRHHHRLRTPEDLADEHRFAAHLRDAGVPVPAVLAADTGAGAITAGDFTYEVHARADGLDLYRDRPSWTPFLHPAHAHAAGAMLATLHRAARSFAASPRPPQPLVSSFTILPAPDPLAAAEDYIAARPALSGFLAGRRWRDEVARLLATLCDGLPAALAAEPQLWTHNDWHPSNLLWTQSGAVAAVFDFGLATRTCTVHDLATALERTAFGWLRPGADMAVDHAAARALIDGYRTVLPLPAGTLALTLQLLPLVHIEFALAEVDYFAGLLARPDHALVAWDDYLRGHADWFASPAGQDALARIGAA